MHNQLNPISRCRDAHPKGIYPRSSRAECKCHLSFVGGNEGKTNSKHQIAKKKKQHFTAIRGRNSCTLHLLISIELWAVKAHTWETVKHLKLVIVHGNVLGQGQLVQCRDSKATRPLPSFIQPKWIEKQPSETKLDHYKFSTSLFW